MRLYRSVLYVPGSKPRAMDKARGLPVDAVIFDLEDAVAPDEKVVARETLTSELASGGYGHRARLVRINGLDTPWGQDDARAVSQMDCEGILIPKAESRSQIEALSALAPGFPVWCMMETPRGALNALEIANSPGVEGFILGTNDLAKDIGCETGGDRSSMMTAIQLCLLAARAEGIFCVDGVYNAFRDTDGFEAEAMQGRSLGMDGKSLIHPSQVEAANRVFAPSLDQIDLAERQIAAYEAALAEGQAVAVVDGRIVENLHVATAKALLARAAAIRERSEP